MESPETGSRTFSNVLCEVDEALESTERAWQRSTDAAARNEWSKADILVKELFALADASNHVQSRIVQNRLRSLTRISQRLDGAGIGADIANSTGESASRSPVRGPGSNAMSGLKPAASARERIAVTPEYEDVRRLVESQRKVVFVTGNAGTGKSTLIDYLRSSLRKKLAVVAPTGVAALNARGATIHSFFHFPARILQDDDIKVGADPEIYRRLELLIIDEVSMVRADLLDAIDLSLRRNRSNPHPFGGVQLVLVGDLFQLPPVVTDEAKEILSAKAYESPYFFSSHVFKRIEMEAVELTRFFRQEDREFIELLNRVRIGDSPERVAEELNSKCSHGETDDNKVVLTGTNYLAERINALELAKLGGKDYLYAAQSKGSFSGDGDRFPSPQELHLKVGAHVMFTRNDEQKRWVNGSLGVVRRLEEGRVFVELVGGNAQGLREVTPATWKTYRYRYDRKQDALEAREAGRYTQYPLMLAWAVTIHKSQGQTLDNVLLNLGQGAFASGQLYVALSRCRSIEGIHLARRIRPADIICDPEVKRFHESLGLLKHH